MLHDDVDENDEMVFHLLEMIQRFQFVFYLLNYLYYSKKFLKEMYRMDNLLSDDELDMLRYLDVHLYNQIKLKNVSN
jgi:hypothetical protein